MPNFNNNGVRRRYWKAWVKAQQLGGTRDQRTYREMTRNRAFAMYMLRDSNFGKWQLRWFRFKLWLRRLWNKITGGRKIVDNG